MSREKRSARVFVYIELVAEKGVDGERHLADLLLEPNTASGPGQAVRLCGFCYFTKWSHLERACAPIVIY